MAASTSPFAHGWATSRVVPVGGKDYVVKPITTAMLTDLIAVQQQVVGLIMGGANPGNVASYVLSEAPGLANYLLMRLVSFDDGKVFSEDDIIGMPSGVAIVFLSEIIDMSIVDEAAVKKSLLRLVAMLPDLPQEEKQPSTEEKSET